MSLLTSKCLENSALMSAIRYFKYCYKPYNCKHSQGFWLMHGMQGATVRLDFLQYNHSFFLMIIK